MYSHLLNVNTMEKTQIITLKKPGLITKATKVNILPKKSVDPLIFPGILCDDGCNITINKCGIKVYKGKIVKIIGPRNHSNIMW